MAEARKTVVGAILFGVLMAVASSVEAQVHHVVGGDVGWDPSTDIASWSAGKIFMVGDKICKKDPSLFFSFFNFLISYFVLLQI